MKDKEIQNKLAFVVIDSNTMKRISKFYSRKGDAERFIKNIISCNRGGYGRELSVAEFEYKTHYKIKENV